MSVKFGVSVITHTQTHMENACSAQILRNNRTIVTEKIIFHPKLQAKRYRKSNVGKKGGRKERGAVFGNKFE